MRTKGELCALAAVALAISGSSTSDAEAIEPALPTWVPQCTPSEMDTEIRGNEVVPEIRAGERAGAVRLREKDVEMRARERGADLWVQVVIKAWSDENFKRELLENPEKALRIHFNYRPPPGVQLEIVEGEPSEGIPYRLVLPPKPQERLPGTMLREQKTQQFFPC